MHTMKLATKALVGLLATTTLGCSLIPGFGGQAPINPGQSGLKPVGWIYTTLYSKNAVLEINNLQSRAEKEPIIVPNGPRAVAVDPRGRGEFLYVVCELGNTVAVVDRRNRLVNRSIDVGREPYGIALSSVASGQTTIDRGFVSNGADDTVSVIDLKTQNVLQTVNLRPPQGSTPGQTLPTALRPQGIAVNAAGTRAYVACKGGQVVVVEAATPNATFSATRFITLTGSVAPQNIAINSEGTTERVYVTDPQGNRLFDINGSNPTNTADVREIPDGPWGVAVGRNPQSGKNDRLYVTVKQGGGALLPLSLPDLNSTAPGGAGVSVEGREPTGVAVSPLGDAVYVSLSGSNTVTVFRRVGNDLARPEQFNIQQLSSQFIAPTGDIALGGFLFQ
jgi:YVTN family beta-propeller protein